MGHLWHKDVHGHHQLVTPKHRHMSIVLECHDKMGHCGIYPTTAMIRECFWWPKLSEDVQWWICSCHLCQLRQMEKLHIPPIVAEPMSLFAKCYMDTMEMPSSGGFKYLVHGHCSPSGYPEFWKLQHQTGEAIANWIFEDILCRWGALCEIVLDNGTPFIRALDILVARWHIHHIRISAYNSQANGVIENCHFHVQESLILAADGDATKWSPTAPSVFWSERTVTLCSIGTSPYFLAHGVHPILPIDVVEATYLLPPPDSFISTMELIACQSCELQKRLEDLEDMHSCHRFSHYLSYHTYLIYDMII